VSSGGAITVTEMSGLDIKRCPHCVTGVITIAFDDTDGFDVKGPALVCTRCDTATSQDEPLFVPYEWE
jgi:hypothetical protein